MQIIDNKDSATKLNNNIILGTFPTINNSKIIFYGKNNILLCEDGVILDNSNIEFGASNSIIFLRKSNHAYRLNIKVFNNSNIYIDENNYFNEPLNATISEETNLIIGKDCMFSTGISIMTSDVHLIYGIDSLERINFSKSIYIGDHVWIGQNSTLLKGTKIDSGSIIGASSVVPGLEIENNSIYAGNPATNIKNRIFWNGACVHKWNRIDTAISRRYDTFQFKNNDFDTSSFIYDYDNSDIIYDDIEEYLNDSNIEERLSYLIALANNDNKNRFVHLKRKNKQKIISNNMGVR